MVFNAVHLDPGDEEHAPTPSLLQVFRITQETLRKISCRTTVRAKSLSRKLRFGDKMVDMFQTVIQMYAGEVAEHFLQQLDVCADTRPAEVSTNSLPEVSGKVLNRGMVHNLNDLWIILCNQTVIEHEIQECCLKGAEYQSIQLDTTDFDLHKSQASAVADDDVSVVSESLESVTSDGNGGEREYQWRKTNEEKLQDVQQSICSMLLDMVSGVADTYSVIVASVMRGLTTQSQGPESMLVHRLQDMLGQELGLLSSYLNQHAFTLLLESTWYSMLRILEAGVLRTTAEWVLNTDSDRKALLSVIDSLSHLWHGDGMGLPLDLIDHTSQRLRTLIQLHASSVDDLRDCYRHLTVAYGMRLAFSDGWAGYARHATKQSSPALRLAWQMLLRLRRLCRRSTRLTSCLSKEGLFPWWSPLRNVLHMKPSLPSTAICSFPLHGRLVCWS